jgi:hypothetical protein
MNLLRMDGHCSDLPEWEMLELAVQELDEKIRSIVGLIS